MKRAKPAGETLFSAAQRRAPIEVQGVPLADRMRPRVLSEVVGQRHLIAPGKPMAQAIAADRVTSMILWGPPGCGKTTLAQVIAASTRARYVPYSAVLGSVPELRQILAEAGEARSYRGERTLLFLDEIHRFNKGQQDALLPDVERGTVVLVGATTENPSFAINAALLSRCRVFALKAIDEADLVDLLRRTLSDERGLAAQSIEATNDALEGIAKLASGDARRALGLLESAAAFAMAEPPTDIAEDRHPDDGTGHLADDVAHPGNAALHPDDGIEASSTPRTSLTLAHVEAVAAHRPLLYDKAGEEHYNVSSALIKSLRGSDPDAALYWMFRMLEAGDDPLFVLRRLMIFASEDIGNADPRALEIAVAADAAFRRMGMPEGAYPMAHACLYLACAPKSDGVKGAMKRVREMIERRGSLPVPMKLRNAVTKLMKDEGYGQNYRNPHAFEDHVATGESYLPDEITGERFYEPVEIGFEKSIAERLERIRGKR